MLDKMYKQLWNKIFESCEFSNLFLTIFVVDLFLLTAYMFA